MENDIEEFEEPLTPAELSQCVQKSREKLAKGDYSEVEDWPGYFASVLGKDALELLKQGWRVVATDNLPEAFPLLWSRVPAVLKPRLTTVQVDFEKMQVPTATW